MSESAGLFPRMSYGSAEYQYEGRDSRGTCVYRWIDPTFRLEERITELQTELRRYRDLVYGPDYKDDAFNDGLGGW